MISMSWGEKNPSAFHRLHYISYYNEKLKAVSQLVVAISCYQQLLLPSFLQNKNQCIPGLVAKAVPYKL